VYGAAEPAIEGDWLDVTTSPPKSADSSESGEETVVEADVVDESLGSPSQLLSGKFQASSSLQTLTWIVFVALAVVCVLYFRRRPSTF